MQKKQASSLSMEERATRRATRKKNEKYEKLIIQYQKISYLLTYSMHLFGESSDIQRLSLVSSFLSSAASSSSTTTTTSSSWFQFSVTPDDAAFRSFAKRSTTSFSSSSTTSLILTNERRTSLSQRGWIVIDNYLSPSKVNEILTIYHGCKRSMAWREPLNPFSGKLFFINHCYFF